MQAEHVAAAATTTVYIFAMVAHPIFSRASHVPDSVTYVMHVPQLAAVIKIEEYINPLSPKLSCTSCGNRTQLWGIRFM